MNPSVLLPCRVLLGLHGNSTEGFFKEPILFRVYEHQNTHVHVLDRLRQPRSKASYYLSTPSTENMFSRVKEQFYRMMVAS